MAAISYPGFQHFGHFCWSLWSHFAPRAAYIAQNDKGWMPTLVLHSTVILAAIRDTFSRLYWHLMIGRTTVLYFALVWGSNWQLGVLADTLSYLMQLSLAGIWTAVYCSTLERGMNVFSKAPLVGLVGISSALKIGRLGGWKIPGFEYLATKFARAWTEWRDGDLLGQDLACNRPSSFTCIAPPYNYI